MIESTFWKTRLRPLLLQACRTSGVPHRFERVENSVAVGTPDVDYTVDGVSGKLELKYAPRHPKRATSAVLGANKGMRRSQVVWAVRHQRAGGIVYLCVGTPLMTWLVDLHGYTAAQMYGIEFYTAAELTAASLWYTGIEYQALVNVLTNRKA